MRNHLLALAVAAVLPVMAAAQPTPPRPKTKTSRARREVRRELRYGRWDHDRDRSGDIVAGVVLGAVIAVAARGAAPPPQAPGLCWVWSDPYPQNGYWDRGCAC